MSPNIPFLRETLAHIDKTVEMGHDDDGNVWNQQFWATELIRTDDGRVMPREQAYADFVLYESNRHNIVNSTERIRRAPACGTAMCIAGFGVWLEYGTVDNEWTRASSVADVAQDLFGLSDSQAEALFAGDNDLDTLHRIVDVWGRREEERS